MAAGLLLCTQPHLAKGETTKLPKNEAPQQETKKENSSANKYLTNYKGIATGLVSIAAAINGGLSILEAAKNTDDKKQSTLKQHLAFGSHIVIMAYISYLAGKSSLKSWRKL